MYPHNYPGNGGKKYNYVKIICLYIYICIHFQYICTSNNRMIAKEFDRNNRSNMVFFTSM